MGLFRGLGRMVKPALNVKRWVGYDDIKQTTQKFVQGARDIFRPAQPLRQETYKQALTRFKLSETDIAKRRKILWTWLLIFTAIFLALLFYTLGLLFDGSFKGAIIGLGGCCLTLSFMFRYHFWLFQLKKRKLGCTLQEWWQEAILRRAV